MKLTPNIRFFWLLLLAGTAAAGRWLTRAQQIYGWDSVHYLLAQDRYDLLAHQPHPPGSYYYVLLARAARVFTGDPHEALLLLSSLFGAGLVVTLYFLGRELARDEQAGWLAAVLGASAPLFWFYGSVGLNYGPAGTLSALTALGCVLACRDRAPGAGLLLAGASLGVLGGFRPTDVVFLAPAYLWATCCAWRNGVPLPKLLAPGAALLLLTAGWLLPNLASTGGLAGYLAGIRGQEHLLSRSSALLAGWPALADALFTHRRSLESLLGLAWLPVLAAPALAFRRSANPPAPSPDAAGARILILGVLIVAPAFLFYLLGHFNSPGYALTYGGFVAAVAAALCARLLRLWLPGPPALPVAALAAVLLFGNGALFLGGWPGGRRIGQRSLSAVELRDHDRYYRELHRFLRDRHPPGSVRLLSSWNSTDGLRVVQALLPEYAADVAQAVGEIPHLPECFASLEWLRLMTPEQIRAEGHPVYLICRTREDPGYHRSLFGGRWHEVPIGPGHVLYRARPGTTGH